MKKICLLLSLIILPVTFGFMFLFFLENNTEEKMWLRFKTKLETETTNRKPAQFNGAVQNQISPRKTWLLCSQSADPKSCYSESLAEQFNQIPLDSFEQDTIKRDSEKDRFIKAYPFEKIKDETENFYTELMKGYENETVLTFQQLISLCLNDDSTRSNPELNLEFGLGINADKSEFFELKVVTAPLMSGLFLCLNQQWRSTQLEIVKKSIEKSEIRLDPETELLVLKWLSHEKIETIYQSQLRTWIENKTQEELNLWKTDGLSEKNIQTTISDLKVDLVWIEKMSSLKLIDGCMALSLQVWVPELRKKFKVFPLESTVTDQFLNACKGIQNDSKIKKKFDATMKIKFDQILDTWLNSLDTFVLDTAQELKMKCLKNNQSANLVNQCIIQKWTKYVEEVAVQSWINSSELRIWNQEFTFVKEKIKSKTKPYLEHKKVMWQQGVLQ